jgi:hypothetical protein
MDMAAAVVIVRDGIIKPRLGLLIFQGVDWVAFGGPIFILQA